MVINLTTEPVPPEMLTMTTQPIQPQQVTRAVTEPVAIAEPVAPQPVISVKVGKVHLLDKTCVDDFSGEFERIGKLLDHREAIVGKVKEHSKAVQKFKDNVNTHITEQNKFKLAGELLVNQLCHDVKNFDTKLDSEMQHIENSIAALESLYQVNVRKIDKIKETSEKTMKNNKKKISKATGKLANTTYEISRLKDENKQSRKDVAAINDVISNLKEIEKALSNGVNYEMNHNYLMPETIRPRLSIHERLSVHEMVFPDTMSAFQPDEGKKQLNNTLQPSFNPNIEIISPSESLTSESQSSFDDLADIPSTVIEVEKSYQYNRDSIQGNTNKLDVLCEGNENMAMGDSDSDDGSLSSASNNGLSRDIPRESIDLTDLDQMLRTLTEVQ